MGLGRRMSMFNAYRRATLSLLLMSLMVGSSLAFFAPAPAPPAPTDSIVIASMEQSDAQFLDPSTGETIPDGAVVALEWVDIEGWTDPNAEVAVANKYESYAGAANTTGYWFLAGVNLTEGVNSVRIITTNDTNASWSMSKIIVRDTICLLVVDRPDTPVAKAAVDISGLTEPGAMVSIGSISATVAGDGTWTAHITLTEGPNYLNIVATDSVGNVKTVGITLVRDMTPPVVFVDAPADDTVVNVTIVTVAGRCELGATVWVNGVLASNSGTTWSALVPLKTGVNTITVTAEDSLGNDAVAQTRTVTYTPPPYASQDDVDDVNEEVDDAHAFSSMLMYMSIILFVVAVILIGAVWTSLSRKIESSRRSRDYLPPATEEVETQSDVEREFEQLEKEIGKEDR